MKRHRRIAVSSFLLGVVWAPGAVAQGPARPQEPLRKQATALRVADGAVRLDGRLEEVIWERAIPLDDFVQKEPTEGIQPTERMEARFVYDGTALYVGARMWSADPSAIQAPLGRRDAADQAEHILVSLDTYLDHRTAYTFGVTASGVRIDRFHPRDAENGADAGFDPVWEARTSLNETGWTAELWIPFSQLRFNDLPEHVWGLNVRRFTPTLKEEDYWVLIPRTEIAWSSRFGELRGLTGVSPTRRLELLPYISGAATMSGQREARNPFDDGRDLASRVGVDLKMGLGPVLTLDLTVNPDFGQVEADPAEVNLTAFDTVFPEKRPFFLEGARMLNLEFAGNYFNSRRIGQRPTGPARGDYVDYPATSTILTAAKVTGRTSAGTSLGLLAVVTDEESARISNLDSPGITRVRVAPRTLYTTGRIRQEFGRLASTTSLLVTNVRRDLAPGDPLARYIARNAFSMAGDAVLRFNGGEYELNLLGGMNHISGEEAAIERLQRSSVHYFQRPDRGISRLDPARTAIPGYRTHAEIERRNGRHWLWDAALTFQSPGMDMNDIGRTFGGDGIRHVMNLRYRETRPGRLLRAYTLTMNTTSEWVYDGDLVARSLRPSLNVTLPNFWTASAGVTRNFRGLDPGLTRGGPMMERPAGWTTTATLSSATASQTRWSGTVTLTDNEEGGFVRRVAGSFTFRPGPRWQLSIDPYFDRTTDAQQYLTTLSNGRPEIYGERYIFAYIERATISTELRLGFTLRPDVNLDVYAEPFASSGRYYDLGELLRAGGRARLVYGTAGTSVEGRANGDRVVTVGDARFTLANRDFNVRSLRSNVVLRWEWRPGSSLYLVWQQDRGLTQAIGDRVGVGDMFRSLTAPGSHVVAIKTSFWLAAK